MEALTKHFKLAPLEIAEQFKFHICGRTSVATFITELAEFCNLRDMFKVMLSDQSMCEIICVFYLW